MFIEKTTLRRPEWPTFEFNDRDGDTCCIQFYEDDQGDCGLVKLKIYGAHGCMALTKEQAIEFANKIIEHAR